jgi:hypothetical protein
MPHLIDVQVENRAGAAPNNPIDAGHSAYRPHTDPVHQIDLFACTYTLDPNRMVRLSAGELECLAWYGIVQLTWG